MRDFVRLLRAALGAVVFFVLASVSVAWAQGSAAPGPGAADSPGSGASPSPGSDTPSAQPPETSAPSQGQQGQQGEGAPAPPTGTEVNETAPGIGNAPPPDAPSDGDEGAGGEESKIPPNMGRIQGTIVDAKTGEPMIEAQITVVKTGKKVLTDVEGIYRITLPPGVYDLRVFAELRPARRLNNVKVEKGKPTRIDVALGAGDDKVAVQEVEVVAAPDTATEAVQVVRRQKAAVVSDGVSAQQIARSPDSTASDSIKRVVGATIQDNRYVVIRGLGGRYSSTLLNGVTLPSPDPDTPSAPLDLFPAALLANLTVAKTFSPDMPGNFAGGLLMIETRDFPTKFTLKLRALGGGDTQSTFRNAYSYKGGKFDFLGFDDGGRALPETIPETKLTENATPAQAQGFSNNWDLRSHRLSPNIGLGATVGNTFDLGRGQKLGFLASATYGNRWTRRVTSIQRISGETRDGVRLVTDEALTEELGIQQPSLGGLVTMGYAPSTGHRINLTSLYTHNTENSASRITGIESTPQQVERLRFRFVERSMVFSQLVGEHSLVPGRLLLGWQGNIAYTTQYEPDMRDLLRARDEVTGILSHVNANGGADRSWRDLGDLTGGGGMDLSFLMDGAKLKAGASVLASERDLNTRRFRFVLGNALTQPGLPSSQVFAPENLGTRATVQENTADTDGYVGNRAVWAAYVMADVVKLDPVRIVLGERIEVSQLDVTMQDVNRMSSAASAAKNSRLRDVDLLPSVNVILAATKDSNLRAGYSRTLARPHFREIAEVTFFDYTRRRNLAGNRELQQTSIHNVDIRWETFLGPTELFAVSGFYKHFDRPIERGLRDGNISFNNASRARVLGVEFESRLSFKRLHPTLEALSLGANLSLIQSRVSIDSASNGPQSDATRALQGQSPYVVNMALGYRVDRTKTQIDALYNVFGRRIAEVGDSSFNPDVYEEALHRLDLTVSQRLPGSLGLKVAATNLLDQRIVLTQDGIETLAYKPGLGVFGTIEWTFNDGRDK